jgi:hypothetical protein
MPQEQSKGSLQDRLRALNERYRSYHGTGDNIIYDERLKPETRVQRLIEHIRKNPDLNISEEEAVAVAIEEMEKMDEQGNLAGNWGKFNVKQTVFSEEGVNIEHDIMAFLNEINKRGGRKAA